MASLLKKYFSFQIKPIFWVLLFLQPFYVTAQCPVNIDFELGDFTNWQCWLGTATVQYGVNKINLDKSAPKAGRQIMLSTNPGDSLDPYGSFPKNCPNGSGHSVQLGSVYVPGLQAQGLSYTFTIPANQNIFNIVFNYAVVIQDGHHAIPNQSRFVITVTDVTDGVELPCKFDPFIAGNLRGFTQSYYNAANQLPSTSTFYKEWTAASINLDGYAGKTIELFFKTSGCVVTTGVHFCYAYIDINSCDNPMIGNIFCSKDTALQLVAPPLFESYRWFDATNTTLGTTQTLPLYPRPTNGDSIFLEVKPYYGYGCPDTIKAALWDTLTVKADAGPDKSFCDDNAVQIGAVPQQGFTYKWSPPDGLTDPNIANPSALPSTNAQSYKLTVASPGGGCSAVDFVNVIKSCPFIKIYVPNAFTPDGNGLNDRLHPTLYGFSKVNYFKVYNRYGQLLFTANNDWPGWDGKINNGTIMDTQTVVWVLEAVDVRGKVHHEKGTTLIVH